MDHQPNRPDPRFWNGCVKRPTAQRALPNWGLEQFGRREGRGVGLILCTRQPSSLDEQLELIVLTHPRWLEVIAGSARHPPLWLQHRRYRCRWRPTSAVKADWRKLQAVMLGVGCDWLGDRLGRCADRAGGPSRSWRSCWSCRTILGVSSTPRQPRLARSDTAHTRLRQGRSPGSRPMTLTRRRQPSPSSQRDCPSYSCIHAPGDRPDRPCRSWPDAGVSPTRLWPSQWWRSSSSSKRWRSSGRIGRAAIACR